MANNAPERKNIVIGGHFRLHVAKLLGYSEVPVVYVNIPDVNKERELNLRLNRNVGEFDYKILSEFDEDLLKAVGFTSVEIDRAFDLKAEEVETPPTPVEPTSKKGDIFQLGNHRLMCGDSTDPVNVALLMGGVKANMIFTDPPYMVDYHSPTGVTYSSEKFGGMGGKIFNDNLDEEKALLFYIAILKNLYEFSHDNATIYWWYAGKNVLINRLAFIETNWFFSQGIIWLKNNMVYSLGQDFHRCYEPCMFGWKKKQAHFKNKEIANLKDTWHNMEIEEFKDALDVWFQNRDNTAEYVHPTQKPVGLAERGLRKSSKQDDIVLDLFGGSGSTLIACEQMHRKAYLMELDPKFVDVIIARWEKLTGRKAVKV